MIQGVYFRDDATPPVGSPLGGGLLPECRTVLDPLDARGLILQQDDEPPLVLLVLDWSQVCNAHHRRWRESLAEAISTTPRRVMVHTTHFHDAPLVDVDAHRLAQPYDGMVPLADEPWLNATIARVCAAATRAWAAPRPVTHVATGSSPVDRVASNRRLYDEAGRFLGTRFSSWKQTTFRDAPEGLIDPQLQTIVLWSGDEPLAVIQEYACHPNSNFGLAMASKDFTGLARQDAEEHFGKGDHLYLTGCAGQIATGKYNNGTLASQAALRKRLRAAMIASRLAAEERRPLTRLGFAAHEFRLPLKPGLHEDAVRADLADGSRTIRERVKSAYELAYIHRVASGEPLMATRIEFNDDVLLLCLPGEAFVEYNFTAQAARPDAFVVCAAYGDCGPQYMPYDAVLSEGGLEQRWAMVGPGSFDIVCGVVQALATCGDREEVTCP